MENKKIMVSCRGVIVEGDKMLLVENRKNENDFYCAAGGRMEFDENPRQTVEREVYEELGVKPQIGRLLYINTFNDGKTQVVDFLYEILNYADYKDIEKLNGTHSHELSKVVWLPHSSDAKVLPKQMWQDFKENNLPKDKERYING